MTTSATREALENLEQENRKLQIKKKQKDIKILLKHKEQSQRVDLCFLVDCTGSMDICIAEVKNNVYNIVMKVWKVFPDLKVRLSFVGYRDVNDGELRFSVLDFVDSVSTFESFVDDVLATGGDDQCEDVFGGIEKCLELDWRFPTRALIHFADAPCHGAEYHNNCLDYYPDGDPHGLDIRDLLEEFREKSIQYSFIHLNESTRKMIKVFREQTKLDIAELDMFSGFDCMEKSISMLICDSISSVQRSLLYSPDKRRGLELLSAIKEEPTLVDYKIVPEYPRSFKSIQAIAYKCRLPSSDSELHNKMSITPGTRFTLKIAKHPFDEGASRICYHGKDGANEAIVLKEFKNSKKNTLEEYKVLIETSVVASYLAQKFSEIVEGAYGNGVSFLVPRLFVVDDPLQTPSKNTDFFCAEPLITGEYKKFNNNNGYVSDENYHQILNAFSHWTYQYTDGFMMVVDLQGVIWGSEFVLTDPAIHCEGTNNYEGLDWFGSTNLGVEGMKQFFRTHECNEVCYNLNLGEIDPGNL